MIACTARRARLLAALAGLALAGCAGPAPGPSPLAEGTGTPLPVSQIEAAALVSAYRVGAGQSVVVPDPALQAAAQAQATAMARANLLSHTVAGSLPRRLAAEGRDKGASAENVSAGYPSLQAALEGWKRSPEHNRNLLFSPMRHIGVAGASAPGTRFKTYWALVMTD